MFTNLIIAVGFGACVGVGTILPMAENNPQDTQVQVKAQPKYASYDDDDYEINLTANELNSYVWDNLFELLDNATEDEYVCAVQYDGDDYSFVAQNNYITWYNTYSGFSIGFNAYADENDDSTYLGNYKFVYYNVPDDEYFDFESSINIKFQTQIKYEEFKHYIELDIQANTQPSMMNPLVEIISLLTGGIVQFATGLGSGVSTLVQDIFLNNGELSVFAAIVVVFAAVSLAIGLSRWVMNFLTSLGAKK